MAKDAFDFSDVFRDVENKIDTIMGKETTQKTLQLTASAMVYKNVYPYYGSTEESEAFGDKDPFKAKHYIRRLESGGLADPDNYEIHKGHLTLTIINNTPGNGRQPGERWTSGPINDIIEEGVGYGWRHSDIYMDQPAPRPFMQDTVDAFVDDFLIPLIEQECFSKK